MPFTTSHPAAVLPLKHFMPRYFSLTGLMAGAMSPDLLYFLVLGTEHHAVSHSWRGMFMIDLPAGILFSFAFHFLFKCQFILNLPSPVDRLLSGLAFQRFKVTGFRQWAILIYSVLFGTLSHFLWDSATHEYGAIVRMFPVLLEKSTIFGITRLNCTYFQHFSTLIGAVILPIYILKSPLMPSPALSQSLHTPVRKLRFWLTSGSVATCFAVIFLLFCVQPPAWPSDSVYHRAYLLKSFGLAGWAGFFYFVCGYTIFLNPGWRKFSGQGHGPPDRGRDANFKS